MWYALPVARKKCFVGRTLLQTGRKTMVRKRAENGGYYHEPPYTEEEEFEFYRRVAGGNRPLTILRAPAGTPSPQKMSDPNLEETMRRVLARRDAATKGSAEYEQAVAELQALFDRYGDDAMLIAEEYNSQPSE
jgi:hypothetical protein